MEKKNTNLNEILRINFKDLNKDYSIEIEEKKLKKYKILAKESEVIRIVKHLNNENNKISYSGFPFVKDLISVKVKISVYNKLADGIITVNNVRFKRLISSSGGVRNRKVIFVREELFDKANEILLCGMSKNMRHKVFAKFSSYYALASTDSTPVTMPNIVVIDDYKKSITERFDLVKEIDKDRYEVENDVIHTETILPFDGAGLVDVKLAAKWATSKLKLNYIPSAFQFRCISGIKGNLYTFDFQKFSKEFGVTRIKDIWGKIWDLEKNNINVIMTKSQFKFHDKFKSYDEWLTKFKTVTHGYRRKFNISKVSHNIKVLPNKRPLSYQPLQSLKLSNEQIDTLCKDTVKIIKKISTNVDEFLQYRGLSIDDEEDGDRSNSSCKVPEYYKALQKNKSLFYDEWIQAKIQTDIKNFKERSYKGAIFVSGNYQTLIPDVFALAQYAFGQKVTGLLRKDEVYSRYWINKKVNEVDIIRFPHIAMEHKVAKVKTPDGVDYFKWITEGIITNIYDSTVLKLNGGDFDGDHIFTTSSDVIISAVKKQASNTIVFIPLTSKQKKELQVKREKEAAETGKKINKSKKTEGLYQVTDQDLSEGFEISNMKQLIETDIRGMNCSIGAVVNQITKLWSLPQTDKVKDYIKIMSVVGSLRIDFAKTGIPANIPDEIERFLRNVKKPYFMKYIYPKDTTKEKRINNNNKILGNAEETLLDDRDCTMNRLCKHMEQSIQDIKLDGDTKNIEWTCLMKDSVYKYNVTYPKILTTLAELKNEHDEISRVKSFENFNREAKQENEYRYRIFYSYARNALLQQCSDIDKLIDYVVFAFYADGKFAVKNKDKALLWNCFGEELNKRMLKENNLLEINIEDLISKSDKLKEKIEKIKTRDKQVKIKLFNTDEPINISKEEINYIKTNIRGAEAKQLAFVLLTIEKLCTLNYCDFEIHQGKKDRINKTHICRLADITDRKYTELMRQLKENGFIKIAPKGKDKTTLTCNVVFRKDNGEKVVEIKEINDCKKYFKKIA